MTAVLPVTQRADVEKVYEEHMPLLVGVAMKHFSIAATEAEALAHDVFLS